MIIPYIKALNFFIAVSLFMLNVGCDVSQNTHTNEQSLNMETHNLTISEKTRKSIQVLSNSKVLFAHHSVGQNILVGLEKLSKDVGSQLAIINTDKQLPNNRNMIAHSTGGENRFPKSKVDSFVDEINNFDGEFIPQIAFMKFCYIDFIPETNVNDVFHYYQKKMSELEVAKPNIKFVHLTVPLTTRSNGIKSKLKRLFGRETWDDASNAKRKEYNNLIINNYPEDDVFDIAKIESTQLNGRRVIFKNDGKTYYSMVPEFSNDGGHLNELGQRVIAIQLVDFLANTIRSPLK